MKKSLLFGILSLSLTLAACGDKEKAEKCDKHFTGENCDQCIKNFTGDNCDQCIEGFTGEECDQCTAGHYGKDCKAYGSVTDQEGNAYRTVEIGEQTWMADNYRKNTDQAKNPNNKESNVSTFGLLYTWEEAASENFCPDGWHLPTQDEFNTLLDYVGKNRTSASDFLALIGKSNAWTSFNNKGVDEFGFEALPAGQFYGDYFYFGTSGFYWSASEFNSNNAFYFTFGDDSVYSLSGYKTYAYSVRCIKD